MKIFIEAAEIDYIGISANGLEGLELQSMSREQFETLNKLEGKMFNHRWQLNEVLAELSPEFRFKEGQQKTNKQFHTLFKQLHDHFRIWGRQ